MKSTTQVALLMLMFTLAMGGRIYPWGEPHIKWPNKGMINEIQLFFSLEDPLPAGGLLRVRLPFTTQFSVFGRVYAQSASRGSVSPPSSSSNIITAVGPTGVANGLPYHSQAAAPFDNFFSFGSPLNAGTQYVLHISITSGTPTDSGWLGYIQMETLSRADSIKDSSKTDVPLRWDSNHAFAPVHILQQPGTLSLTSAIDGSFTPNTAAATYNLKLTFKLSADFWYWPTILVSWDNANFIFSNCISIDNGTNVTPPTAMTSTQFTCSISQSSASMVINHNAPILKTYNVIYNVTVANPSVVSTTSISAWVYHRYNLNLTDFALAAVQLSVTTVPNPPTVVSPNIINPKLLLSWGIDAANLNDIQKKVIHIYTSPGSTTGDPTENMRFQAMKFQFDTATTMPSSDYTVNIAICATNTLCKVLLNSIDHSFDSTATCTVKETNPVSIECTGVSTLKTTANQLGARIWLSDAIVITSDALTDASFGFISVSWTKPTTSGSPLTLGGLDSTLYKRAQKLLDGSKLLKNLNGNGPIIATNNGGTLTTIKSAAYTGVGYHGGIFGSTTTSAYKFGLLTSVSTATAHGGANNFWGNDPTGGKMTQYSGVDLFLNHNLWTVASSVTYTKCAWANTPDLAFDSSAATNVVTGEVTTGAPTANLHCNVATVANTYTRLRAIYTGTTGTVLTTGIVNPGVNKYLTFAWNDFVNLVTYGGTSVKADKLVDDVYGCSYTVLTGTVPATGSSTNDLGELGGSTLTAARLTGMPAQTWFFNQHRLAVPTLDTAAISTQFGGVEVWFAGGHVAATTWTSNQAVSLLRFRGTVAGSDSIPATPTFAIFFRGGNSFSPLGPSGDAISKNEYRCWTTSVGTNKCYQDRFGQATEAQILASVTPFDFYAVITTSVVFSTSTSNSVSLLTKIVDATATTQLYRHAWLVSKGLYWLDAGDKSATIVATAGTTASLTGNAAACGLDTGTHMKVRISPDNTQNDGSVVTMKFNYQGSSAVTATAKKGGLIWCGQWNWQASGLTISTNTLEATPDKCVAFDFRSNEGGAEKNWWCLYCPIAGAGGLLTTDSTGSPINMTNFRTYNAKDILNATISLQFADGGGMQYKEQCDTVADAFLPQTASASTVSTVYSQPGQKVVFTLTVPNTLREVDTVVYEGKTSTSVSDGSFPQGSFDTNAVCLLAPSGSLLYNEYDTIGCPSSGSAGSISFSVTNTLNELRKQLSSVKIVTWGFNGAVAAASNPAQSQLFIMYTVRSTTSKVDATKNLANSDLISWALSTSAAPLALTVSAIGYNRPILNSRGSFRWEFTTPGTRPLWESDAIVFNLDAVVSASENKDTTIIQCRIKDSSEQNHNQNFKSCTLDPTVTPPTLTIIPWFTNREYAPSNVRVLLDGMKCISIPSGAAKTVWGSVNFRASTASKSLTKDNLGTELATPGSDVSARPFPTNYPVLKKYWGNPNSLGDLEFTLISNFPINDTCRVTIEFPTNYADGLSTRSIAPTCVIDNTPTRCTVNVRSLTIDGFPVSKSINTQFVIRVSGVAAPQAASVADKFWLQINQDSSEGADRVVYSATINDVLQTGTTVNGIHINWHTSSSVVTRSVSTLVWTLNLLNTEDHNSTRGIQVHFPPWWGLANGRFTPTCRVYDYAVPSNVYSGTQTILGNTVSLSIQSTLLQNRILNLECQNVRTPEFDGTYPSQDIQIRIVDPTGTTEYQRSAPSVHNVNYNLQYTKVSTLAYIDWDITSVSSLTGPRILPRGTYGIGYGLNVPGRSSRNYQVNVSPGSFAFYNSVFNVSIGYDVFSTLLGCGGSVPVNTYALLFTISDNSVYTVPSAQWVSVTTDQVSVGLDQTGDISIAFTSGTSSKSNPVTFWAYPFSDVTITPSTTVDNNNFTVSPTSVTLNPIVYWSSFVWSTTGSTTATGGAATYSFALSGTNAASFKVPTPQLVKTVADTNNYLAATPTLSITAEGNDQGKATFKVLSLTLGGVDTASIYFGCQIIGTWTLDAAGIWTDAVVWGALNELSPEQGQYDWIVTNKPSNTYTMPGLLPNYWYECRGFANSQSNKNSSIASYTFRTGNNGAPYNRFLFNQTTYPNPAQRQALLCSVIQRLATPFTSVFAITGETCGNQTAFYNTDNSSGSLAVYFWPRKVEVDDVMTLSNLQSSLNTTASLTALNSSVVANGGLSLYSILADGTPKRTAVSSNFPSSGSVGDNWVAVSGISLNETGFVAAVLGSNSSSLTLQGLSSNSPGLLAYQIAYYAPALGSLSYNFSNLQPGTGYNLFLVGANDDPSFYFHNFTSISTISLTTTAPPTNGLALFCSIVMALIAMISILI